ncbi:hypothetical protein ALP37_200040 [Pseudomonas amygdali pv. sesami]|nr:hypothetical protein ALP37_200040 [Pseudomonas amygdali pv. sesami]
MTAYLVCEGTIAISPNRGAATCAGNTMSVYTPSQAELSDTKIQWLTPEIVVSIFTLALMYWASNFVFKQIKKAIEQ